MTETTVQEPLGLPGGTIRTMLIGGFAVCAAILYSRGQLGSPAWSQATSFRASSPRWPADR